MLPPGNRRNGRRNVTARSGNTLDFSVVVQPTHEQERGLCLRPLHRQGEEVDQGQGREVPPHADHAREGHGRHNQWRCDMMDLQTIQHMSEEPDDVDLNHYAVFSPEGW